MTRGIVDSFFENQKEVAPNVHAQLQIPIRVGGIKFQGNVPQGENFIGVLAHLASQITQTVALRIDGPNYVAHRGDGLTRNVGNRFERIGSRFIAVSKPLFGNFAKNADAREISSDVIVQIRGDARAHIGNFEETRDAIAIE